jgi:hypothetical protein
MAERKENTIAVTLHLTPGQIRDAYYQLLQVEHGDWFDEPEVLEELLKRDRQALKEFQEGKTIPWEEIYDTTDLIDARGH